MSLQIAPGLNRDPYIEELSTLFKKGGMDISTLLPLQVKGSPYSSEEYWELNPSRINVEKMPQPIMALENPNLSFGIGLRLRPLQTGPKATEIFLAIYKKRKRERGLERWESIWRTDRYTIYTSYEENKKGWLAYCKDSWNHYWDTPNTVPKIDPLFLSQLIQNQNRAYRIFQPELTIPDGVEVSPPAIGKNSG